MVEAIVEKQKINKISVSKAIREAISSGSSDNQSVFEVVKERIAKNEVKMIKSDENIMFLIKRIRNKW
jgi:hypothetical protein